MNSRKPERRRRKEGKPRREPLLETGSKDRGFFHVGTRDPRLASAADVLGLQRLAGNQTVVNLARAGHPAVQRAVVPVTKNPFGPPGSGQMDQGVYKSEMVIINGAVERLKKFGPGIHILPGSPTSMLYENERYGNPDRYPKSLADLSTIDSNEPILLTGHGNERVIAQMAAAQIPTFLIDEMHLRNTWHGQLVISSCEAGYTVSDLAQAWIEKLHGAAAPKPTNVLASKTSTRTLLGRAVADTKAYRFAVRFVTEVDKEILAGRYDTHDPHEVGRKISLLVNDMSLAEALTVPQNMKNVEGHMGILISILDETKLRAPGLPKLFAPTAARLKSDLEAQQKQLSQERQRLNEERVKPKSFLQTFVDALPVIGSSAEEEIKVVQAKMDEIAAFLDFLDQMASSGPGKSGPSIRLDKID